MLSVFDIFKIGVGPSSSHTNGPMIAAFRFREKLLKLTQVPDKVIVNLYGSLSLTGVGHHTDKAVILGLLGNLPDTIDIPKAEILYQAVLTSHLLAIADDFNIHFVPQVHILFHQYALTVHENALKLEAYENDLLLCDETYYSVGGGFVYTELELQNKDSNQTASVPYDFTSAKTLLSMSQSAHKSIDLLVYENELTFRTASEIELKAQKIWQVISACVERGITQHGVLAGGLNVQRRAGNLYERLTHSAVQDELTVLDWVNLFAFAVSEENADGGQVVTSPTNGAAGVIPSVLKYYEKFVDTLTVEKLIKFLMVAGAIGYLYKKNASISGAEVGCQGEIGVSSSMAAAGLTALNGGSNEQICIAAEIAMEHSLGMTCDPIGGLVQVPCIERNAMGALKAINAARMAILRQEKTVVSLDNVIETMYKTGKDMNQKYRETSLGGLALIQITPCE